MRTIFAAVAGTAAIALGAPGMAGATTYCVGTTGADCYGSAYAGTGDGLQTAIHDADLNVDFIGTPDTVRIGPGLYKRTTGEGFHTAGGDITIEGAGQTTVLTTDAASNRTVLGVDGTTTTADAARNLRVDLAGSANGIHNFLHVSDVRVTGPGTAIVGIRLLPGSRLTRAVVDPAAVLGDAVSGYGSVAVEDLAVRLRRAGPAVYAVSFDNDSSPSSHDTVRHLTVLGDATTYTTGVVAEAVGDNSAAHTLSVDVRDSVLRGLTYPLSRFALNSPDGTKHGNASIAFRYSSLDASKNDATGDGSFTPGPGNLPDPDPLFGGDLRPLAGSPLIDAGDPAGPEAGDSATDAGGGPRIVGARRDIGAFEFQPAAAGGGPGDAGNPGAGGQPGVVRAAAAGLVVAPRAFRAAAHGPVLSAARRASVGARVTYTLNVDALVRFSVRQSLPGRRVRSRGKPRCVKPAARNRRARRCRRVLRRGSFGQDGLAGLNAFRFRGRLKHRKLPPGRYTLVAVPSANGISGKAIRTPFRIVR